MDRRGWFGERGRHVEAARKRRDKEVEPQEPKTGEEWKAPKSKAIREDAAKELDAQRWLREHGYEKEV